MYENNDFDERTRDIVFNRSEINSLGTRGKAGNKYEIIKMVLARFGISLKRIRKSIRIDKKYEIKCVERIYNLVKCSVLKYHNEYDALFVKFLQKYNKYYGFVNIFQFFDYITDIS